MQSEVIYLTREGDKVNYSGTITWLLEVTHAALYNMYSVAVLRGSFSSFSSFLDSLLSSVSLLNINRLEVA